MENNLNETFGLQEQTDNTQQNTSEVSAEKTLSIVATVILIGGIIGALVMLFTITYTKIESGGYSSESETVANPTGIILMFATLFSSIAAYAVLKVICNISNSLKEINAKTK